jgi:hypothetical protein
VHKCVSAKVLAEMSDAYIGCNVRVFLKIGVVKSPVVGEIGAYQHYVTGFEPAHAVTYELSALPFFKMYQFQLCMKMPVVVDIWNEIPSYAERVPGLPGNFKQLRSHIMRVYFIVELNTLSNWRKLRSYLLLNGYFIYGNGCMSLNYNVFVKKIQEPAKF